MQTQIDLGIPENQSELSVIIGETIEIEGVSRKGKNRVREQGSTFEIEEIKDRVLFSDKSGPWLLLKSNNPNHGRWIHATEDKDFRIKTK